VPFGRRPLYVGLNEKYLSTIRPTGSLSTLEVTISSTMVFIIFSEMSCFAYHGQSSRRILDNLTFSPQNNHVLPRTMNFATPISTWSTLEAPYFWRVPAAWARGVPAADSHYALAVNGSTSKVSPGFYPCSLSSAGPGPGGHQRPLKLFGDCVLPNKLSSTDVFSIQSQIESRDFSLVLR
jgi:hypothetical protein